MLHHVLSLICQCNCYYFRLKGSGSAAANGVAEDGHRLQALIQEEVLTVYVCGQNL